MCAPYVKVAQYFTKKGDLKLLDAVGDVLLEMGEPGESRDQVTHCVARVGRPSAAERGLTLSSCVLAGLPSEHVSAPFWMGVGKRAADP